MITWNDLIGHDRTRRGLAAALRGNRLGGSFLMIGPPGIGKRTVATLLAQTLLCPNRDAAEMDPCGVCPSCQQVIAGTHPDVVTAGKPPGKTTIPLEQLIGPPDARMQTGFCRDIRLRPSVGTRRMGIIEDADDLNEEGANCLLKTLEEPPQGAVIVLIGTSEQRQLPTIRSRCQILRLGPLLPEDAVRLFQTKHEIDDDPQSIAAAIEMSGGDLVAAERIVASSAGGFRDQLSDQLLGEPPDPLAISRLIHGQIDSVKDAAEKRVILKDVFSIGIQVFRRKLRSTVVDGEVDPATLGQLDRSIRAIREVEQMANHATLIECYAAEISRS